MAELRVITRNLSRNGGELHAPWDDGVNANLREVRNPRKISAGHFVNARALFRGQGRPGLAGGCAGINRSRRRRLSGRLVRVQRQLRLLTSRRPTMLRAQPLTALADHRASPLGAHRLTALRLSRALEFRTLSGGLPIRTCHHRVPRIVLARCGWRLRGATVLRLTAVQGVPNRQARASHKDRCR
jgi:hypothetical protein